MYMWQKSKNGPYMVEFHNWFQLSLTYCLMYSKLSFILPSSYIFPILIYNYMYITVLFLNFEIFSVSHMSCSFNITFFTHINPNTFHTFIQSYPSILSSTVTTLIIETSRWYDRVWFYIITELWHNMYNLQLNAMQYSQTPVYNTYIRRKKEKWRV